MNTTLLQNLKNILLIIGMIMGGMMDVVAQGLDTGAPTGAQVQPVMVIFTTTSGSATIQKWHSTHSANTTQPVVVDGFPYYFDQRYISSSPADSMNTNGYCGEFVIRSGDINSIRANGVAVVPGTTTAYIGGLPYSTFTLPTSILSAQPWGREANDKEDLEPTCEFKDLYLGPGAYQILTLKGNTYYDFEWVNHNTSGGNVTIVSGGTGNDGPFTITGNHNQWYSGTTDVTIRIWAVRNNCAWDGLGAKFSYKASSPTLTANDPTSATICTGSPVTLQAGTASPSGATIYWQNTNQNGESTSVPISSSSVSSAGTYYYRANWNGCWSNPQSTVITMGNQLLTIDAGPDKIIECSGSVELEGEVSYPTPPTAPSYGCTPKYPSGVESINRVRFNTIDNISNSSTNASVGDVYEDFTSNSTDVLRDSPYTLTVWGNTAGSYTNYIRVYIDWDRSGTFDGNEVYDLGTIYNTTNGSVSTTITVPTGASVGETRMRVMKKFSGYDLGPCDLNGFGQAEDYTINILPSQVTYSWSGGSIVSGANTLTPTVNPTTTTTYTLTATAPGACPVSDQVTVTINPLNGGTLPNTTMDVCKNLPFELKSNGASAPPNGIQWQKRINGGAWQDMPGATTNPYMTNPATDNPTNDTDIWEYRLKLSCDSTVYSTNTLTVTTKPEIDCYCIPPSNGSSVYISNVTLNGEGIPLNNASGSSINSQGVSGYSDYTNTTITQLSQDESYTMSIQGVGNGVRVRAWIDFNDNGVFETNEEIIAGQTLSGTLNSTINIPLSANPGTHRMRVRLVQTTGAIDPCLAVAIGETEDYRVTIIAKENCQGTPEAGIISGPSAVCTQEGFTLFSEGYTVAQGMAFQWQFRTSTTGSWTNINGANSPTLQVPNGITNTTYYRLRVTCILDNDSQNYSNELQVEKKTTGNCVCIPDNANDATTNHEIRKFELIDDATTNPVISNSSTAGAHTDGYMDYANAISPLPELEVNKSYTPKIQTGTGGGDHKATVWIDFNGNGEFTQIGELVSQSYPITANANMATLPSFQIPATVSEGTYRLRIQYVLGNPSSPDPCIHSGLGETEDYLVKIVAPDPCNGAANPGIAVVNTPFPAGLNYFCTQFNVGDPLTLISNGADQAPGIVYQWQVTDEGMGNWQDIVGLQNPSAQTTVLTTTVPATSKEYRLKVTCINSNTVTYSNEILIKVQLCYCLPDNDPAMGQHHITNFTMKTDNQQTTLINKTSTINDPVNGYSDYTNDIPAILFIGDRYRLSAITGAGTGNNHSLNAWIDYDNDGVFNYNPGPFDVVERIFSKNDIGPNTTTSFDQTAPILAYPGLHRLRVRYQNSTAANTNPCYNNQAGETEDYMVRVVSKDCPNYSSTMIGTGEACAGQAYQMVVENTACAGMIYLDVRGTGSFTIKSATGNGTWSASGNQVSESYAINPAIYGNVFTLTVSNYWYSDPDISIWNNGNLIIQNYSSSSGTEGFSANTLISPATLTVHTPDGDIKRTLSDCRDLFLNIPLENPNYCTLINVELPWDVTCDATGNIISSGTHDVTVYPQVPVNVNNVVDIVWDEENCMWDIQTVPGSDCDASSIGTIFTVTPSITGEAYMDGCNDEPREFTITYNGYPGSPNCCDKAGPTLSYETYSVSNNNPVAAKLPVSPDVTQGAAKVTLASNGPGGMATDVNLEVDISNFCTSQNWNSNNRFHLYVYIDGMLAAYEMPTATAVTFNYSLQDLWIAYNSLSTIEVYMVPYTWGTLGGDKTVFVPSCTGKTNKEWSANIKVTLDATFEDTKGSPGGCEGYTLEYHDACEEFEASTTVAHANPIAPYYCFGNEIDLTATGGTEIDDNEADIVNLWYAVPGDDDSKCDNEGYIDLFNDLRYDEDLCNGGQHNQTTADINKGILNLTASNEANDPWFWMFPLENNATINADQYRYINIRYRFPNPSSVGTTTSMQLFFTKNECGDPTPFTESRSKSVQVPIDNDDWHTLSLDMTSSSEWNGLVTGFRLDYIGNANYVSEIELDFFYSSRYPIVGEGKNLTLKRGDEFYPDSTTTYYAKKLNRCGFTECYSTLAEFPNLEPSGYADLSSHNMTATCWVKGDDLIEFWVQDWKPDFDNLSVDNILPQSGEGKFVAAINPNGNETVISITSNIFDEVTYMEACDNPDPTFHTAFLQRGFLVQDLLNSNTTINFEVYFPIKQSEVTELAIKAPIITPQNSYDNVTSYTELVATKYDGDYENDTPLDNCPQGLSIVFDPMTKGVINSLGLKSAINVVNDAKYFLQFSVPNFSEFWFHSTFENSPLPIQLTGFSAICEDNSVRISWQTASENNVSQYELFRSRDGYNWTLVGELPAAGNSNVTQSYSIVDKEGSGLIYYRLENVDYDGQREVFGPISSDCNNMENTWSIHPIPVVDKATVTVNSKNSGNGELVIVDNNGKVILAKDIKIEKGSTIYEVDASRYSKGVYMIYLKGVYGYKPLKFVKF